MQTVIPSTVVTDGDIGLAYFFDLVRSTGRAHDEAKRNYWELLRRPRELPTLEHPEGSGSYRKVVEHERFTLNAHIEAIARLNKYLQARAVPDDVREQSGKAAIACAAA
jgi:hypothetical protein